MLGQQLILDRYRIIGRAGAGGYATVQHAFDTRLKRDVAIKCIPLSKTDVLKVQRNSAQRQQAQQSYRDVPEDVYEYDDPVLPGEPSFLRKRDEIQAKRSSALGRSRVRQYGDAIHTSGMSRTLPARPYRKSSGNYAANTADIKKLAMELPGTIAGAGHTKIASIDDAVDIDPGLIKPERASRRYASADASSEQGTAEPQRRRTRIQDPSFIQRHIDAANGVNSIEPVVSIEDTNDIPGLEEARTAAHLNDANIVTVYDCVVDGQMAYVIMEYVEGKTLARVMRELENDITLDMVTNIFVSVVHALEVAHKAGVLHLDIKPENVVINKDGVVKVTDFGLSTLMDASGQGTTGGGTIGYMPLEQMRQEPLDVRTDEWALASLTYEMLSGVNPFRAKTLEGAEKAIENAELVLPSVCWDVDESIDDVMFKALDPDLEERYGTITAFSKDLTPLLGNAKDGKNQLADVVVNGVSIDDDAVAEHESTSRAIERSYAPRVSLVDRLGDRGMGILMRIFATLSACMISAISMLNFRFGFVRSNMPSWSADSSTGYSNGSFFNGDDAIGQLADNISGEIANGFTSAYSTAYGDASLMGLFSLNPIVAWILLAVIAVVTFIKPKFGMPLTFLSFFVMLVFNQAWSSAFLILATTIAWWWLQGRWSDEECSIVMMQPLFGSVGFASLVPILAGALLDVKQALGVCLMAGISGIVFASLGSCDIMNWAIYSNFIVAVNPNIAGVSIMDGLARTFSNPYTWSILVSWVAGGVLYSLFCWKGTRTFDILGSIVCGAFIIGGVLFVPLVLGTQEPLSAMQIVGSIVPAIFGVILAVLGVTDKVRTVLEDDYPDDEEEYDDDYDDSRDFE